MHSNQSTSELSIDLLTEDFNSHSFFMYLRRQNERNREISISQHDHQYRRKYSTSDQSRGFARLHDFQSSNSGISSHMLSEDAINTTVDLSEQLLDDDLSLVRRHWRRSKLTFANRMEGIQSDFNSQTNISLKKAMSECQKRLAHWICKNRSR